MSPQPRSSEMLVIDDDVTIRELLASLFTDAGYRVTSFKDGETFAATAKRSQPACLIMDVLLPGRSGLEILKEIDAMTYRAPIIIMTGHATVPIAVEAIKSGAYDVIEKPFDAKTIVDRVREMIDAWHQRNGHQAGAQIAEFPGVERLTQREREVLAEIAATASNKEAGRHLGLSPRTIEVHRAHIMMKLGAKNTADLVRLVLSKRPVN